MTQTYSRDLRERVVTAVVADRSCRAAAIFGERVARGATVYVSGPAAKTILSRTCTMRTHIRLWFTDYSGYPTYDQASPTFKHGVIPAARTDDSWGFPNR
jgi:WbqC-like protein family